MDISKYDLTGRAALISGASLGLGLSIARRLARAGAGLFLCARGEGRLKEAAAELESEKKRDSQKILWKAADVSMEAEVNALAKDALTAFPELTILVSNAGIYGPMGRIEDVSAQDFLRAVEINLMGPVLLSRALIPHFRKRGYGKIIQVSGGGATNPMPKIESYAASKAAVVRLMESLALDLADFHVDVNSIAPGLLDTRLLREVLEAGPEAVGKAFYDRMKEASAKGTCTDPELAAALCQFLASAASDGITGKLISAVWDDYESWPTHLKELLSSDAYTLRRLAGRDRGLSWGDK
ncbi:MAG: SDR family oxidoreductase [Deltaproteobacteria bacterium]|nr:SDR family oxidoreductase [Deltaproteobacteria bacterium]